MFTFHICPGDSPFYSAGGAALEVIALLRLLPIASRCLTEILNKGFVTLPGGLMIELETCLGRLPQFASWNKSVFVLLMSVKT